MLIISHQDILKSGCFDIELGLKATEEALLLYNRGEVLFPDKISQIFNQEEQSRINCMPATILPREVSGMKWVAVFPENPRRWGLPNVNASILLSDLRTGYPIAFMDGTLCSNLRTASISAIAAQYLSREDAETIGFIGAGEQAKMHFLSLMHVRPRIKTCKVSSRSSQSEQLFIQQMSELYPQVDFVACHSSYEQAAVDSDIIVTAISAQLPLLKAEWLKKGVYYNHVGGWEDDYNVPLAVDKIVCDDWNAVKHRTQTISRLYQMGRLKDEDVYADLHRIVAHEVPGRQTADEKIYFNPVGLSYVDVNLAHCFYKRVSAHGFGCELKFIQESVYSSVKEYVTL